MSQLESLQLPKGTVFTGKEKLYFEYRETVTYHCHVPISIVLGQMFLL